MSELVDQLSEQIVKPRKFPLQPETLIVPGYGTGQWIKQQLGDRNLLSANIRSVLPASFVWSLYKNLLESKSLSDVSPYQPANMTWHLMSIIKQINDKNLPSEGFESVSRYIKGEGDEELRAYQLCEKLATLFDQYLIFRPEWILGWDQGKSIERLESHNSTIWQQKLWQLLTEKIGHTNHRANLYRELVDTLSTKNNCASLLPERISLFGLSSLPPKHLHIFEMVSNYCPVDVYFLNPCQEYWGDQVSEKYMARKALTQAIKGSDKIDSALYLSNENPILSAMGKQGREFHDLLTSVSTLDTVDLFLSDNQPTSLLHRIQQSLLDLESEQIYKKETSDNSVQIHSCHSRMREVEVLYEQLQFLFIQSDALELREIVVMMPDVGQYAPYIQAVFTDLPFTISDRSAQQESSVASAFLLLSNLPNTRLSSVDLMNLLEIPAIAKKFKIEQEELSTISQWIKESGIRWGLDGEFKHRKWDLPADDQNTWSFGSERLILGYTMGSDQQVFEDSLPYNLEGSDTELLGHFLHFISRVEEFVEDCGRNHSPTGWHQLFTEMLNQFFLPEQTEELALDQIRVYLQEMADECRTADYSQEFSLHLITYYLNNKLQMGSENQGLLNGRISFCNLVPMRSLPFEVICLLGMNDGEYPRLETGNELNLIKTDGHKPGDRSRNMDDRYLFLEAVLSAKSNLYISYEGKSNRDNTEKVASVLVSELCSHAIHLCGSELESSLITEHPLQPFDSDYFNNRRPDLVSTSQEWYNASLGETAPAIFLDCTLNLEKDLNDLRLEELCSFFRHPTKYFLVNLIGAYYSNKEDELSEVESFTLDNLEKYNISQSALESLIKNKDKDQWKNRIVAEGRVPSSALGLNQLDQQWQKAIVIFKKLEPFLIGAEETRTLHLAIGNHLVSGAVNQIYNNNHLYFRTGKAKQNRKLETWIKHLALNSADGNSFTHVLDSKPGNLSFCPIREELANGHLEKLIGLFLDGHKSPIAFHPEYSWLAYQEIEAGRGRSSATQKILATVDSSKTRGQGLDPYEQRLFEVPQAITEDFMDIAEIVYAPFTMNLEESKESKKKASTQKGAGNQNASS